jgi:hypothetical protein
MTVTAYEPSQEDQRRTHGHTQILFEMTAVSLKNIVNSIVEETKAESLSMTDSASSPPKRALQRIIGHLCAELVV